MAVKTMTLPLILKFGAWPDGHKASFEALFIKDDWDNTGPASHWANGTRRKRTQSYGHWLSFLIRNGFWSDDADPVDQFQSKAIVAFIIESKARIKLRSVYSQVSDLLVLAMLLGPQRDWSSFKRLVDRLRVQVGPFQIKPRFPVSAGQIWHWSLRELERLRDAEMHPTWQANQFRNALIIGLLISCAERRRSFSDLKLGQHLRRTANGFDILLGKADVKDKTAREFPVPDELVEPLNIYLRTHRPHLARDSDLPQVWVSIRGTALAADSFACMVESLTLREFGCRISPHGFRSIAATSIAEELPGQLYLIPGVLSHASMRMSQEHYNRSRGVAANRNYQKIVRKLRRMK